MKHIMKCTKCGAYTLSSTCPSCDGKVVSPIPPKYSPDDKYGKYRREEKRKHFIEKGLLKE